MKIIDVQDVETAMTLRFLGSPSIRVNGVDIEPGRQDGPINPSRRRILSARFPLTFHPASRRRPVNRRYPYRPERLAKPTIAEVTASSSDSTGATWCRVFGRGDRSTAGESVA